MCNYIFGSYFGHDLLQACRPEGTIFLGSLLVCLGPTINFSKCELHPTQHFSFLGLFWYTVDVSVSLGSDKLLEIQQLAHSLLQTQPVTVCHVMSFWARTIFMEVDIHSFTNYVMPFRVTC